MQRPSLIRRTLEFVTGLYVLTIFLYLPVRLILGDRFWPVNMVNTFAHLLFLPLLVLLVLALVVRSWRSVVKLLPVALINVAVVRAAIFSHGLIADA